MNPKRRFRQLRRHDRWVGVPVERRGFRMGFGGASRPVLVTAGVVVLVTLVSIGLFRLGIERNAYDPASTPSPSVSVSSDGAVATIVGTAPTTSRTIAGVGRPGGPTAAEITRLRALAARLGQMQGQPVVSASDDDRYRSAYSSTRNLFGSAVHEWGGTADQQGFFLVIRRAPTTNELQLLRLLPFTVRLHWGPRISVKERDRQQIAAGAALRGTFDAGSWSDDETDAMNMTFWPDRDHPKSAAQVATEAAAIIGRFTGAAPTFAIRVTDESKTAAGRAVLKSHTRTVSDTGVRLLVGSRPEPGVGVGLGGRLSVNAQHCVALGDAVIIAPPGSSISADGSVVHAEGVGDFRLPRDPTQTSFGGAFVDRATAATYLPRGSTLCGAQNFLLLEK